MEMWWNHNYSCAKPSKANSSLKLGDSEEISLVDFVTFIDLSYTVCCNLYITHDWLDLWGYIQHCIIVWVNYKIMGNFMSSLILTSVIDFDV